MPRHAQVTVDMAVGMVIFIAMVAVSMYYISYIGKPKQPFEATLQAQGFQIAEKLRENISWTVFRSPVWISSPNSSIWNYEIPFQPEAAVDQNSIAVLDANLTEIPSAFSENKVIWVSNISSGKNEFYLTYSKNTALSPQSYFTDLNSSGLSANNSAMKVLFAQTGILSINFGGTEMLGNGIDLGTSSTPQNTKYSTFTKISYADGTSLQIYSNLSKITVSSNHTINPVLYLQSGFTNFYNGTANSFSGSGQQFNSILNFTDVYSSQNGVAVIGKNLNVSVYDTTYKEIRIYNTTGFEIYMHTGTYGSALPEKEIYLNVQSILGLPDEAEGISLDRLSALASLPYADIRSRFAGSSNFNLTVENTASSMGRKIPADRNVITINRPATILGRAGNITETYLNIAVWLGSDYA